MFQQIAGSSHDTSEMFRQAAQLLVEAGQLHQLFDLRLLEHRHRLGLSLQQQTPLDELTTPIREQLEHAYLDACREVGELLLDRGRARDAWTYLRPAGEKQLLRNWLAHAVPDDEHADELIELALYEAIDAERGFAWLLAQRGTCNAITEFDALATRLTVDDQRVCAAVLVRHMHKELLQNVRGHLQRLDQRVPETTSIVEILHSYPKLLDDGAYHIDTSHLATTVRFARTLTDPKLLKLAIDLASYGQQLAKDLQYPDQPPFEDLYRTHLLLFRATQGEQPDSAIEYFRGQAETVATEYYGTSAIEAYLILLTRVSQAELALDEYDRLVPPEGALSGYAPTLLQLAEQSGCWERYLQICQQRNDAVGYMAGLLTQPKVDRQQDG